MTPDPPSSLYRTPEISTLRSVRWLNASREKSSLAARLEKLTRIPSAERLCARIAAELPKGWEGHFELERGNSSVDDFVARMESSYNAGRAIASGTLYQYVTEADGSVSTYQFDGVVFRLANAGVWRGDQSVRQRLEFFAAARRRI